MLNFLLRDKTIFISSGEPNYFLVLSPYRLECGLLEILFGTFEIDEEFIDIVIILYPGLFAHSENFFR